MGAVHSFIEGHVLVAALVLVAAFTVLAKCADLFVDSSVGLASRLKIPKLIVGIVLVSLATTLPELSVSALSALRGSPEIALGNAVGSVICNTGLGLAVCALISVAAVPVIPHVLLRSGGVFLLVGALAFLFTAVDSTLTRWEGFILVLAFGGYLAMLFLQHRRGEFSAEAALEDTEEHPDRSIPAWVGVFAVGLVGIIVSSDFIVISAVTIARAIHVPESVIALTLIALGTSVPEVATCVTAARRNHGALAVGNILGANIMNICWVAGASAMIKPLALSRKEIYFMFPAMFVIVLACLGMLRNDYQLTRRQGFVLLGLYLLYLGVSVAVFPPQG